MDMLVYILPVSLFVITLIIILALRAEDKKSRSLSNVKEKIVTFRNEATQTMKRVQETCHDSIDKIQAKQDEANHMISDINLSLENLKNHRRDLAALESICKGYEVTLEKLRLQTEHAENRISVVQDEVRKAESVNTTIESFKVNAQVIEEDIVRQQESVKAYLASTKVNLDAIVQEHQDKEREMLSLFSDELSKNREEFGSFLDEARNDLAQKRSEADSALQAAILSLSDKEAQIIGSINGRLEEIDNKKNELSELFEERNNDLKAEEERLNSYYIDKDNEAQELLDKYKTKLFDEKALIDSFFDEKTASLKELSTEIEKQADDRRERDSQFFSSEREKLSTQVQSFVSEMESREASAKASFDESVVSVQNEVEKSQESILNARENLATIYSELEGKLKVSYQNLFDQLQTIEKSVNEKVDELSVKRDGIVSDSDRVKAEISSIFESTISSISESLEKAKSDLQVSTNESIEKLSQKQSEVLESASQGVEEIKVVHQKEVETMNDEAESFISKNKEKIAEILNSEASRIDGVYRAMNKIALETIENLASRQSDIKESVSWLNQGADETIANTVERLGDLQRKINEKQAQLEETQKRVTETKEELFNLTEQNKEANRELTEIVGKFESENKRLETIKRERMEEEALLVRKKIENDSKENNNDGTLANSKSKKSKVTIQSFPDDMLLGDEEDLLSED